MKNDDTYIITRILSGHDEDYAILADRYGQAVFTLIVRMVDSREDAEELTQDTFLKAFQHLSSFNAGSSFSTWLYRIACNTALSALRRKQKEVTAFDERLWNTVSDELADEVLDECSDERIALLQAALKRLPPDERALLTLYYEEERPLNECARILNLSEGNAKVKLHRLRKKLYLLMKEEEKNHD